MTRPEVEGGGVNRPGPVEYGKVDLAMIFPFCRGREVVFRLYELLAEGSDDAYAEIIKTLHDQAVLVDGRVYPKGDGLAKARTAT